jgi:protein-L-isoaspartate(D-aspartate) O-methyltransferase
MTIQSPSPDFRASRAALLDSQLRPQGVSDPAVLQAMGAIEREKFLPSHTRPLAYADRAVAIGDGRYIAAPAMLGSLLTAMSPEPGQRALVIGAGSGYSAAVLSKIGLEVVALESSAELAACATELGIKTVQGPLEAGWAKAAPYDQILIDGAIEHIPDAIVDQLAEGGRLGAALASGAVSRLIVGRKSGGAFGYLSVGDFGAPALPGFDRPQSFNF